MSLKNIYIIIYNVNLSVILLIIIFLAHIYI